MRTRYLQLLLALDGIAAVLAVTRLAGTLGSAIAAAALVLGTILAAPAAPRVSGGWWTLLASGASLLCAGQLVALVSESIGGLISVAGGVAALGAAVAGFPLSEE